MKQFPWQFREQEAIGFYPDPPNITTGDILEIGPGRGDVLLSLAQDLPEKRIVGIELGNKRYQKLITRINKLGLSNVQLIACDARIALMKYYQQIKFEKIYVLFPDPWPKNKHEHLRLLHREFIQVLTDRLQTGGSLYMATDVDWYANWAIGNAESIGELVNQGEPFVDAASLYKYTPTYFEQKWRFDGRNIYYMHFLKR